MAAVSSDESEVLDRLLEFARELEAKRAPQEESRFTDIAEADRLIESDPNAFLLGALFTQGMPAERAWAGPYLLMLRLGHLDLSRIARMDFDDLAVAFAAKPALHRFKREMARYVQAAARRVVADYGGDASRIWRGRPTARELQQRLGAFDGIGQKKAAMITEILPRHFGVEVREPSGSDVAGDVHVRRVMYRAGLARSDDVTAVVEAARRVYPRRPGMLDLACWLIGRRWCHAVRPKHDDCLLGDVCPRVGVEGS